MMNYGWRNRKQDQVIIIIKKIYINYKFVCIKKNDILYEQKKKRKNKDNNRLGNHQNMPDVYLKVYLGQNQNTHTDTQTLDTIDKLIVNYY